MTDREGRCAHARPTGIVWHRLRRRRRGIDLYDKRLWRHCKINERCVEAHGKMNERRLDGRIQMNAHDGGLGRAAFGLGRARHGAQRSGGPADLFGELKRGCKPVLLLHPLSWLVNVQNCDRAPAACDLGIRKRTTMEGRERERKARKEKRGVQGEPRISWDPALEFGPATELDQNRIAFQRRNAISTKASRAM